MEERQLDDVYNIVGGKHLLSEESWTVSIARKKQGRGADHAFLIIEGIKNSEYKIIRADLFVKQGAPLGFSAISGESGLTTSNESDKFSKKSLPGSSGEIVLYASNASGQSEIVIKQMVIEDLQKLEGDCEYQTFGITAEEGDKLIKSIEADVGAKIGYNLCGDGSSYSCSFWSQRYHSCVSWAMEKLKEIDCEVKSNWHDFAIKITSKIILGYEEAQQEDKKVCCQM